MTRSTGCSPPPSPSTARTAQASPHTVSPLIGLVTPAAKGSSGKDTAALPSPVRGQNRAAMTVPRPGTECRSKRSASRETAPRPMPRVPALDVPSARAAGTFVIPGPESTVRNSTPAVSPERTTRSSRAPSSAWRCTFVAASVTARATSPARWLLSPMRRARAVAAPRAATDSEGPSRNHARSSDSSRVVVVISPT